MDFSSDPLHDPMGSSPLDTTPMDTGDTPDPVLPSALLSPNSISQQTPLNRDSSSPDPMQEAPFSFEYSAPTDRPTRQNRKRGLGLSPDHLHPNKEPRVSSS